VTKEQVYI